MAADLATPSGRAGPNRRRFLTVAAAFAGAAPTPAWAVLGPVPAIWRGVALGAEAQIQLAHRDAAYARQVLSSCVQEVRRLEAIFSLYQPGSTLAKLNRHGRVATPEFELVDLIGTALQIFKETGGAFDISLQPLWRFYADHFARPGTRDSAPPRAELQKALALVGSGHIRLSPQEIVLERKGMALSLNGIAQGYITDRIRDLLKRNGFTDVLIDLGEIYGGGSRPDGSAWRAGLSDPAAPKTLIKRVSLRDRALASSSDAGFAFSPDGHLTHLIDPRTGQSPKRHKSVSVLADNAETADALSTAFAIMPLSEIAEVVARRPNIDVMVFQHDGRPVSLPAG